MDWTAMAMSEVELRILAMARRGLMARVEGKQSSAEIGRSDIHGDKTRLMKNQ